MTRHRVLVTGSAGAVGSAVCAELMARGHFVRGLDLRETPEVSESRIGSIHSMTDVDAAMESMTALVHLAAEPDDCDFLTRLVPSNIVGVYNVMDSARRHGVRRAVLASSGQTVGGLWRKRLPVIRLEDGAAPGNGYAVTKVFLENMGQMYWNTHKISCVAIRIGWFVRNPDEARAMQKWSGQNSYLSHGDCGRLFALAVEKPDITYACVFGISKPPGESKGRMDLTPAREILGYEPQDEFPQGLPFSL